MSHSHWEEDWGWGVPNCTEIDQHVCLRPTTHGGDPDVTDKDGKVAGGDVTHLAGYVISHDKDNDKHRCEGGITVDEHFPEHHRWQQTGSLENGDLTLTPSVLCGCGFHGWVRDGKWVAA